MTHTHTGSARRRTTVAVAACALFIGITAIASVSLLRHSLSRSRNATPSASAAQLSAAGWPVDGQAAYQIDGHGIETTPHEQPVPIASVAKVMTAYVVLHAMPLQLDEQGPSIAITDSDVADTRRRKADDESVVPVRAGESLSERQALTAMLLPSANNIAIVLARTQAGSVGAFVAEMNATAKQLGMRHTTYTDPSGFDPGTVSTAGDQVLLAQAAMKIRTFAAIVALDTAQLPVAGTVHNTDKLLGTLGFVGIKTGSDDAAGGCFMFRTYRIVDDTIVAVTGVVLGQKGPDLMVAAQSAAAALADRISPRVPSA